MKTLKETNFMKKLCLLLVLALIAAAVLFVYKHRNDNEAAKGEDSGENGTDAGNGDSAKEPIAEEIPSFEELLEINDLQKIFETKSNIYAFIKSESDNPEYQYTAETVYFDNGDKTDYHEKTTYASGEITYMSSVGNGIFYSNPTLSMVGLEIGAQFYFDYTLDYDSTPIGKGYIENGYIVYHSYNIFEGYPEYDYSGSAYLNTLYFNKDTKLLEKYVSVTYGECYAEEGTFTVDVSYDVTDPMSKFGTTAYDIINNAEELIDVELIVGFNTPEETSYSLKAPADAELFIYINEEFYSVYTDAECTNEIFTLEEFAGEEKVTVYAAIYDYSEEEVRYTVTAEEWAALTEQRNYTVDAWDNEYGYYTHNYTDGVINVNGYIVLFIEDKQYLLEETERGIIAYDCTYMEFINPGLLSQLSFDEFFFDEELLAYVNKDYEEAGIKMVIHFEDGVPVSSKTVMTEDETDVIIEKMYTNVGTTVITLPEFTFEYELEPNPATLVTEEQWNQYVNEKNYAAEVYVFDANGYGMYNLSSDGDAFMLDETIIVSEGGKLYALVADGDTWRAVEYDGISIPDCLIPGDFAFSDFEYDIVNELYVMKDTEGAEVIYSFSFENGVLVYVQIEMISDIAIYGLMITEIGTVAVAVPEYVVAE